MQRQARQVWQRGRSAGDGRRWLAVAALWAVCCCGVAVAERGSPKARKRAAPPARWDKGTAGTFFDDAFGTLQGERPTFSAVRATVAGPAAAQPAGGGGSADGFKWSNLISEGTLTDEVKDMKGVVAGTSGRPADFKGGGYDKAREAFSSVALAFAVIADYDQDVRWKKDAATARDLFARVGFNCKVGTDQSLAETKLRLADLEAMLDGNPPQGKSDREDDFVWSQVAGRPPLMKRLEEAEAGISAAIASKGDFDKQLDRLVHDAEIVAAIGEAVQRPDYEYHDDDTYRGYAAAMRAAALEARSAAAKEDYDAVRAAVGTLKKSCDTCHGDYRS